MKRLPFAREVQRHGLAIRGSSQLLELFPKVDVVSVYRGDQIPFLQTGAIGGRALRDLVNNGANRHVSKDSAGVGLILDGKIDRSARSAILYFQFKSCSRNGLLERSEGLLPSRRCCSVDGKHGIAWLQR